MGNQVVALNQKDVSVRIRMLTDADGTPATGITDASAGHVISYQRGFDTALVTDGGSAADLALITSAHSDWGFFEIGEGWYRVDFPDAAFAEGVGSTLCTMATTAESAVSVTVIIEPLFKYQGTADSVTTTTTTFPTGTTPLKGDIIMVVEGTGEPGNQVLVTSVTGEVATHAAFETGISATTTTILLIAGDAVTADGGINCDASVAARATPAQVNTECDQAISDASLATAAKLLKYFQLALRKDTAITADNATEVAELNADEGSGAGNYSNQADSQEQLEADLAQLLSDVTNIQGDTNDIQTRIPAALSGNGNMESNIAEVNDIPVTGDGQAGTEWGP